jgi:hypothetical protein
MLISIILSVTVLPAILFFIVCLLGFHQAMMGQRSIRVHIECLEADMLSGDCQPMTGRRSGPQKAA